MNTKTIIIGSTTYTADLNRVRAKEMRNWSKRMMRSMNIKVSGNDFDVDVTDLMIETEEVKFEIGLCIFGLPADADLTLDQLDVLNEVVEQSGFMKRLEAMTQSYTSSSAQRKN